MKHIQKLTLLCFFFFWTNMLFAQGYLPGNSYSDSTGYIEYLAGDLPVIISAPHGGYLEPDSIPDCPNCSTLRDAYTQEIARGLSDVFYEETGCYPHVIINLLHRIKLDANRNLEEAAGGFPLSEDAWYAYHEFIDSAKAQVLNKYGKGLFLDLHGHGHDIQRIEIGYLLSKNELQLTEAELNSEVYIQESSIRSLVGENVQSLAHTDLLRGDFSFGTLLDEKGFPSVPSSSDPYPLASEPYFTGGYNTARHGSRDGGDIDGLQLEFNSEIRFDSDLRAALIQGLSESTVEYIDVHYNNDFTDDYCSVISHTVHNTFSEDLTLFPNPASNFLYLKSGLNNIDIDVYNLLGQKLAGLFWEGRALDISFLEEGFYFLTLRKNGEVIRSEELIINKK